MGAIPGVRGNVYRDRLFDASGTITTGGTANSAQIFNTITASGFNWVNSTGATNSNVQWLAIGY